MISIEALRAMVAAGATAEMVVAVIEAELQNGEQRAAARRNKDALRQRRKRASKVSRDIRVIPRDSADAVPSTLPSTASPIASRAATRGVRLPGDWLPSEADSQFAVDLLGEQRARQEVPKFRDYWQARAGAGALKRDWSATWRNWCRNAAERELPVLRTIDGGANHANSRRRSEGLGLAPPSQVSAAADRLIADAEKREREAGAFTIDGEFSRVESG